MRAAIRTLVALTLLAWGQLVLAEDYWWQLTNSAIRYSSALEACQNAQNNYPGGIYEWGGPTVVQCGYIHPSTGRMVALNRTASRYGDACPSGASYNPETGACDPSQDCSKTAGDEIIKAQACQYNAALKTNLCDDQIAYQGCLYTIGKTHGCTSVIEQQSYQCTSSFVGTGQAAPSGENDCQGEECSKPSPDRPDTNCVTANGVQTCLDPQKPGCGSVNGVQGCFKEEPGCGYFNGTYRCVENDKPNRNCGYFDGKQTCFDPKDPTKVIPESSSDHPKNGGNADGDDTNDPRPSKGDGSNPQGADQGATNEAIEELGETLGPKIDKTNDLLDGISGQLGELLDGLFGEDYDGKGTGSDEQAGEDGKGAGEGLAGLIDQKGTALLEGRDQEAQQYLDQLPGIVERSWFGSEGEKVGLNNVLDKLLPSAAGCANYTIAFALGKHAAPIVIPVCELTRIKPLLEWLIWMLTFVGLWKIFYAGLRQDDAKAAKGGF